MPTVYESGTGSVQALRAFGTDLGEACTFLADTAHRQFLHSLMICEALASLDLGMRTDPHLRLSSGWPEILGRAPETTRSSPTPFRLAVPSGGYVVPDGVFGIEYRSDGRKAYRFFALEADRGTMPVLRSNPNQTSYVRKVAAYREVIAHQIHKKHWGIPNLLVLTLTTGEARMTDMLERLEGQAENSATFLFKAIRDDRLQKPMPQLLTEPWQRAGLPSFRIDESD